MKSIAAVFMVITSLSDPNSAKIAVFKDMKECESALPNVKKSLKRDKDVASIECIEGDLVKETKAKDEKKYDI